MSDNNVFQFGTNQDMISGMVLHDGKETQVEFLSSISRAINSSDFILRVATTSVVSFLKGDYGSATNDDFKMVAKLNEAAMANDIETRMGVYVISYPFQFVVIILGKPGEMLTIFDQDDLHGFAVYLEQKHQEKSKLN